jgi:hypothetical protein
MHLRPTAAEQGSRDQIFDNRVDHRGALGAQSVDAKEPCHGRRQRFLKYPELIFNEI